MKTSVSVSEDSDHRWGIVRGRNEWGNVEYSKRPISEYIFITCISTVPVNYL